MPVQPTTRQFPGSAGSAYNQPPAATGARGRPYNSSNNPSGYQVTISRTGFLGDPDIRSVTYSPQQWNGEGRQNPQYRGRPEPAHGAAMFDKRLMGPAVSNAFGSGSHTVNVPSWSGGHGDQDVTDQRSRSSSNQSRNAVIIIILIIIKFLKNNK